MTSLYLTIELGCFLQLKYHKCNKHTPQVNPKTIKFDGIKSLIDNDNANKADLNITELMGGVAPSQWTVKLNGTAKVKLLYNFDKKR